MPIRRIAAHVLALALLWWVLVAGETGSWGLGLVVVTVATATSFALPLARPWRMRTSAIPGFVFFFVKRSVWGGIDVARRALHPRLPIDPVLVDYRLHLPPGPARVFMLNTLSLLPGTVSADLHRDRLTAHVIDAGLDTEGELRRLERLVARLFDHPLEMS